MRFKILAAVFVLLSCSGLTVRDLRDLRVSSFTERRRPVERPVLKTVHDVSYTVEGQTEPELVCAGFDGFDEVCVPVVAGQAEVSIRVVGPLRGGVVTWKGDGWAAKHFHVGVN